MKTQRNIWYAISGFLVLALSACGGGGGSSSTTRAGALIDIDTGLVAYYPFNGDALDESGNGNDITENNATMLIADKNNIDDSAYFFDGVNDYMIAPIDIRPATLPQVTMTAWVRADSDDPVRQVLSNDNAGFHRSLVMDYRGGGNGWSTLSDYAREGNRKVGLVPVYAITKRHPAMQTACLLMKILKRDDATSLSLSASRLGRNENAHCRLADCISAPIKNLSNLYWGDSALAESRLTKLFFILKKQVLAKSLRMANLLKWLEKATPQYQLTRKTPKTEYSVLQPCTKWVEVVCYQSTLKGF